MDILVIESSPHKKGSLNLLAEHFIQGAEEAGYQVTVLMPRAPISIPALGVTPAGCLGRAVRKTIWQGCGSR